MPHLWEREFLFWNLILTDGLDTALQKHNFNVTPNWLTVFKAATPIFSLGQVLKTNWTYRISFMTKDYFLICLIFKFIMQEIDLEIKYRILFQRHGSTGWPLASSQSFFRQLNWTGMTWPVVFSRHLWKSTVENEQSVVVRWQDYGTSPDILVRSPSRQEVDGKLREDGFLLVLQSLCMNLQNSNGKLLNLVFLKNCSMLVLKLEILIQNRGPLTLVWVLHFYSGARACYSFIIIQNWIHKQNFV